MSRRAPAGRPAVVLTLYPVCNYVSKQVFQRGLKPTIQLWADSNMTGAKTILIIYSAAGMSGILTIHTHTWFTLTARLCTFWCKNRERLYFNRVRIYIKNSGRSRGERGCTNMTKCIWSEWPHFLKVFFCVEVSQRLFHCRSSSSKRSSKSKEENREEDRIIYLELNFFFH